MENYSKQEDTETETKNHETIISSSQTFLPSIPSTEELENISKTRDLIHRLKESNLGLTDDDFDVLKYHKIIGRTFLLLTEEKLESRGVKLGPTLNIICSINKIRKKNSRSRSSSNSPTRPTRMNIDDDLDDIDILQKKFKELVEDKFRSISGLKSKVNFSLLAKDVYRVCGEDTISVKTLREFYFYNTKLSKHTYPIVRKWVDHKMRVNIRSYRTWFS
ncbi:unnamed protein product [Rhizophagus irregularis]|uniref:SAM domain-containing protein n=1 Tax=Rhizophagus irregularis TaxID=588596 RepID=A0A915ZJP5_9GLOM|nr:unnamed protein product [Rhizophagus irregularis]